jgi:hypothetical protein
LDEFFRNLLVESSLPERMSFGVWRPFPAHRPAERRPIGIAAEDGDASNAAIGIVPRDRGVPGRALEDRSAEGLFGVPGFAIIPALRKFHTSTLVIHGDSGHFSCIDAPERVHRAIDDFFRL